MLSHANGYIVCVRCARHTSDATQRISIRPDTIWPRALACMLAAPEVRPRDDALVIACALAVARRKGRQQRRGAGRAGRKWAARPPARSLAANPSALGGHRRTNQAFACEMLRHLAARACAQVHLASSSGAQVHAKAPGALRGAGGLVSV